MFKCVAVVGATGAVGEEFLQLLEARNFPADTVRLFASARSVGASRICRGKKLTVEDVATAALDGIDLAFFSAGAERSRALAPHFVKVGAVVIDNSSAFRMDTVVPLVIPEINPHAITTHRGIIANPNCSTIIGAMALWPLHRQFNLQRFTVATYQAVSGAGRQAMVELTAQTRLALDDPETQPAAVALPQPIAFNLFPQVDVFTPNGYSKEEMKFVNETRKIFSAPDIRISATCVRVPTLRCHAEAIHAEFAGPVSATAAREVLRAAPGVVVADDPEQGVYPMPRTVSGQDAVYVGRIRQDVSAPNGLALWVVGDQLRKGAALNAIQIAERLL